MSARFYKDTEGLLKPKVMGPFTFNFHWDEPGATFDSGIAWDSTTTNAVIRHQLNQEGYPTSGISTTPHIERALLYAKGKDGVSQGFIYKIARADLGQHQILEFVVAKYAKYPSVPEDDEVILVLSDSGHLPNDVVQEIIPVFAASK